MYVHGEAIRPPSKHTVDPSPWDAELGKASGMRIRLLNGGMKRVKTNSSMMCRSQCHATLETLRAIMG